MDLSEKGLTAPRAGPPAAAPPDSKLAAAILQKDRKATAEFVVRYADEIYGYVRSRMIPRMDLVDDLVQEVFLAAWQGLADYKEDAPLGAWLHGIARHKVENYYRSQLRAPLALDDAGPELTDGVAELETVELLDRERLQAKTRRVLAALPETHSLALLWRYWEKSSAQEMAARTGKTVKAIERLLARARQMFRERWEDA